MAFNSSWMGQEAREVDLNFRMLHLELRRSQRGGLCFGEARPRARREPDCGGALVAVRFRLLPFDIRSWPPAPG